MIAKQKLFKYILFQFKYFINLIFYNIYLTNSSSIQSWTHKKKFMKKKLTKSDSYELYTLLCVAYAIKNFLVVKMKPRLI